MKNLIEALVEAKGHKHNRRAWLKRRMHRNERRSAKQALKGGEYGEE